MVKECLESSHELDRSTIHGREGGYEYVGRSAAHGLESKSGFDPDLLIDIQIGEMHGVSGETLCA
jgi:hypothetical protein